MAELLTAARLMAAAPPYLDHECQAWGGTVRLVRLSGPDKLRITLAAAGLDKHDGQLSLSDPANFEFAVDVLAMSIVDGEGQLQFADATARAWLSGEVSAVAELLGVVMNLNGLGGVEREIAEAKKD